MAQMKITRRQFLNIVAVSGGAGLALKLGLGAANNSVIVKDTRLLMGTIINLSVIAENKSAGELAVEATFAELERQVAIFNHREDNSPVAEAQPHQQAGKAAPGTGGSAGRGKPDQQFYQWGL